MKKMLITVLLVTVFPFISYTENSRYKNFEKGLEDSSVRINGTRFHNVTYSIDEKTASEFFSRYFKTHQLNRHLEINLVYPVFHWRNNHLNLQKGITAAFLNEIESLYTLPSSKRNLLLSNEKVFKHYFYINVFLQYIPKLSKDLTVDEQFHIAEKLKKYTLKSKAHFSADTLKTSDLYKNQQALKIQQMLTLISFADKTGKLSLLDEVADLNTQKKALWNNWKVMLIDNGYFNDETVARIKSFMQTLPRGYIWPRVVLCYNSFIPDSKKPVSIHRFGCSANFFNTFPRQAGTRGANQFPDDYKAVHTDRFMSVFIHELMHGVDSVYIEKHNRLNDHKLQLLKSAGSNREKYLRRMFNNGFFKKKPQEFIASISNMYFAGTMDTFKYALQKTKEGNYNQISQFLFFASLFVKDEMLSFYRITDEPDIHVQKYPVEMNENRITSIKIDNSLYIFKWGDTLVKDVKVKKNQ